MPGKVADPPEPVAGPPFDGRTCYVFGLFRSRSCQAAADLPRQQRHQQNRAEGAHVLPLRDGTHNGVTVPSPQETGHIPPSTPQRQDPQRCHGPVTAGKQHCGAGLPKGWRRSRGILAQVRIIGGDLRRETASSASQWRRSPREKQTCSAWPGDLRHREKGPAPPEGGPAPRTAAWTS